MACVRRSCAGEGRALGHIGIAGCSPKAFPSGRETSSWLLGRRRAHGEGGRARRKSKASWKGNRRSTSEAYSLEFGVNWATWSSRVNAGRKADRWGQQHGEVAAGGVSGVIRICHLKTPHPSIATQGPSSLLSPKDHPWPRGSSVCPYSPASVLIHTLGAAFSI